ncbi:alpha/beta hydrolase [Paraburkholderia oxyphila]|uniref:alpha/beta hydrolase n=1 Tax=Paraburkholderia oxyphila TaxID=614212 RepID=UPI001FE1517B|nr:alpha/beta hydrolase [Paraburkholderia oxyphila]
MKPELKVGDVIVRGYVKPLTLRSYRPICEKRMLPVVIYLHGGGFAAGDLDEADNLVSHIARQVPAWVVSVEYSLAPRFPFPAAPEDAYIALTWATNHARAYGADPTRIAVAGHDAGGSIAASVAAIARDRNEYDIKAQVLIEPLLDPSLTRRAPSAHGHVEDLAQQACARNFHAYLPDVALRMHPYTAPIESRRLGGLPPALLAYAASGPVCLEVEAYAAKLTAAGVPVETARHSDVVHYELKSHPPLIEDVILFLQRRLCERRNAITSGATQLRARFNLAIGDGPQT